MAPETLRREPAWVVVAAVVTGIALWLAGGRFSRPLLSVAAAAAGGFLGVQLPQWLGWGVDAVLAGIVGAAALGLAAFLLDQICVGAFFGVTLAFWAGVAAWATVAPDAHWAAPVLHWSANPADMARQLWQLCPAELRSSLPGAAGCGVVMGMSLGMLWPRLSRAILCNLLGLTLIVAVALPGLEQQHPGRIASLLPGSLAQAGVLAAMFAAGLALQWWTIRRSATPRANRGSRRRGPSAPRQPVFPGAPLPEHKPEADLATDRDASDFNIAASGSRIRGSHLPRFMPDVRMVA
jgi:hypothetical protein